MTSLTPPPGKDVSKGAHEWKTVDGRKTEEEREIYEKVKIEFKTSYFSAYAKYVTETGDALLSHDKLEAGGSIVERVNDVKSVFEQDANIQLWISEETKTYIMAVASPEEKTILETVLKIDDRGDALPRCSTFLWKGVPRDVCTSFAGEDSYHGVFDQTFYPVYDMLRFYWCKFKWAEARNKSVGAETTTREKGSRSQNSSQTSAPTKPDVTIASDGVEIFQVEVKPRVAEKDNHFPLDGKIDGNNTDPLLDLALKTHMCTLFMGTAPFLPGLAIYGTLACFAAVCLEAPDFLATKSYPLHTTNLDLSSPLDRVRMVTRSIKTVLLMKAIDELLEINDKRLKLQIKNREPFIKGGRINLQDNNSTDKAGAIVTIEKTTLRYRDLHRSLWVARKRVTASENDSDFDEVMERLALYKMLKVDQPRSPFLPGYFATMSVKGAPPYTLTTFPVALPKYPPNDFNDLLRLTKCVLHALGFLHSKGWVHRDVRPENILRLPDGNWVLLDLEMAAKLKATEEDEETAATSVLSGAYPELLREEFTPSQIINEDTKSPVEESEVRWTPRIDVWQLAKLVVRDKYALQDPSHEIWAILNKYRFKNIMHGTEDEMIVSSEAGWTGSERSVAQDAHDELEKRFPTGTS